MDGCSDIFGFPLDPSARRLVDGAPGAPHTIFAGLRAGVEGDGVRVREAARGYWASKPSECRVSITTRAAMKLVEPGVVVATPPTTR